MDYTVRIELSITADSAEEAAKFAIDDLRDTTMGPWNLTVIDAGAPEATEAVTVEVG